MQRQDEQSLALPIFLILIALIGCIYCAVNDFELLFACFSVLGVIGVQEWRATADHNEPL